jgi:hypothetical protein
MRAPFRRFATFAGVFALVSAALAQLISVAKTRSLESREPIRSCPEIVGWKSIFNGLSREFVRGSGS